MFALRTASEDPKKSYHEYGSIAGGTLFAFLLAHMALRWTPLSQPPLVSSLSRWLTMPSGLC